LDLSLLSLHSFKIKALQKYFKFILISTIYDANFPFLLQDTCCFINTDGLSQLIRISKGLLYTYTRPIGESTQAFSVRNGTAGAIHVTCAVPCGVTWRDVICESGEEGRPSDPTIHDSSDQSALQIRPRLHGSICRGPRIGRDLEGNDCALYQVHQELRKTQGNSSLRTASALPGVGTNSPANTVSNSYTVVPFAQAASCDFVSSFPLETELRIQKVLYVDIGREARKPKNFKMYMYN
jgi:hypothetical protein